MPPVQRLARRDRPDLAYRFQPGSGPTPLFLPGYMSDMAGGKASALMADCAARGQACLLFDYAGCGLSDGDFAAQSLIDWRDDALAVLDHVAPAAPDAPVLLVGSSMGGWLMLLTALALNERGAPEHVAGLVGIAAAPDFTDWGFSDADRAIIQTEGQLVEPSPYGDAPYVTTRRFWESGQASRLLDAPIALDVPVRLLHGMDDADVPWQISVRLADALTSADVQVTLVKGGDHRLSQPDQVKLLVKTVADLSAIG